MQYLNLDREWAFRRGMVDSLGELERSKAVLVNLPHDGMIGTKTSPDAPGLYDTGYFSGGLTNYTKFYLFPKDWEGECVGLSIDGAMMNASIDP